MQLFHTVLPMKESFDSAEYMRFIHTWMAGSRFYTFENMSWDPSKGYDLEYVSLEGNALLKISSINEGTVIGSHLTTKDSNGTIWPTDVIFDASKNTLSVTLNREANDETCFITPTFKTPHLLSMLMQAGVVEDDGYLAISNSPLWVGLSSASVLEKAINKTGDNKLPVVYLSQNVDGKAITNPYSLAKKLQGAAHVLVEADARVTPHLQSTCDSKNAYLGGIGIYFPGNMRSDIRFIPQYIHPDSIEQKIFNAVVNYLNQQQIPNRYTWDGIQNQILREKQDELSLQAQVWRESYAKEIDKSQGLNDIFDQYAANNDELQRQVDTLTTRNQALEVENNWLKQKLQGQDAVPLLFYGSEEEFYPGEIKNILLDLLNDDSQQIQNTRRGDIVNDLLEANDFDQSQSQRKKQLKEMLTGYKTLDPKLKSDLKSFGYTITGEGKHYKLVYYDDPRYVSTMSKTGSDHRGGLNLASELINKML